MIGCPTRWMMSRTSRVEKPPGSRCETPGAKGRIQHVDIDRETDRRRNVELQRRGVLDRLDRLDAEALELVAVMVVDRAQPDLDQAVGQLLLHDAGEGRGVRPWIALIGMIDVPMRIDMVDGEVRVVRPQAAQSARAKRTMCNWPSAPAHWRALRRA